VHERGRSRAPWARCCVTATERRSFTHRWGPEHGWRRAAPSPFTFRMLTGRNFWTCGLGRRSCRRRKLRARALPPKRAVFGEENWGLVGMRPRTRARCLAEHQLGRHVLVCDTPAAPASCRRSSSSWRERGWPAVGFSRKRKNAQVHETCRPASGVQDLGQARSRHRAGVRSSFVEAGSWDRPCAGFPHRTTTMRAHALVLAEQARPGVATPGRYWPPEIAIERPRRPRTAVHAPCRRVPYADARARVVVVAALEFRLAHSSPEKIRERKRSRFAPSLGQRSGLDVSGQITFAAQYFPLACAQGRRLTMVPRSAGKIAQLLGQLLTGRHEARRTKWTKKTTRRSSKSTIAKIDFLDDDLPLLPIRNHVLFPGSVAPFRRGVAKKVPLRLVEEPRRSEPTGHRDLRAARSGHRRSRSRRPAITGRRGRARRAQGPLRHSTGNYSLILQGLTRRASGTHHAGRPRS